MEILFILSVPVVLALCPLLIRGARPLGWLSAAGYLAVLLVCFELIGRFLRQQSAIALYNFFYLDALSLFFMLVVLIVALAAALYSTGFIARDVETQSLNQNRGRFYYVFFNLFIFSMLMVTVVNSLGAMWVAIELTTLVSAFLVGFYNTKNSVEAAWKYIIICSVGIILALLGTILFSYALIFSGGARSLNWLDLMAAAGSLNGNVLKIAFIFILVGYGTKAGLAPMHTWLPDAHSQAVSPASALLSGVLLKTSIYAILRFVMIVNRSIGPAYTGHLLLLFGLISLIVAAGFIVVQKDLKRLLAYSSIEHIGLVAIGLGLGGLWGVYGALLHVFNHAVTKSLLFFGAGNIVKKYDSHNLHTIHGVVHVLPFTGIMVLIGVFAVAGLPPFSIFFSELIILAGAFLKGSYLVAGLLLILIAVIFGALVYHFGRIMFGKPPKDMAVTAEPVPGALAFVFLLFFICVMGLAIPDMINRLLLSAVALVRGI
ncbi:MAG: proton-conducting transporter membrane subunit [Candidatus Margulisbacteria bacterium]|nr:proton-conducting transporter membrane subunit [Candidatus Margulisiibacteriota bacterium]